MRPAAFLLQFEQKTIGQISFLHHHLLKVIVTFILIITIIIIIIIMIIITAILQLKMPGLIPLE